MTKFTKIDKNACKALRTEMQAVLDKYAKETGLTFTVGNMKFTESNVEIKVEARLEGTKPIRDTRLDQALKLQAMFDKLTLDPVNGRQLVGYNGRAYKMPYIYLDLATGKRYKTSVAQARFYFASKVA